MGDRGLETLRRRSPFLKAELSRAIALLIHRDIWFYVWCEDDDDPG